MNEFYRLKKLCPTAYADEPDPMEIYGSLLAEIDFYRKLGLISDTLKIPAEIVMEFEAEKFEKMAAFIEALIEWRTMNKS